MILVAACGPMPPSDADYVDRMSAARAAKDVAFRNQPAPVPEARKSGLLPLLYYPIDRVYDVAAALTPSDDATARPMIYSDGAVREVRKVGTLKFLLNGHDLMLSAFVEVGAPEDRLFAPFGDLTNGGETYPAGRLLTVERTASGVYDLDFNRAYNPDCYYSPGYSCPVPPKENRLPVAIQAGERIKAH